MKKNLERKVLIEINKKNYVIITIINLMKNINNLLQKITENQLNIKIKREINNYR